MDSESKKAKKTQPEQRPSEDNLRQCEAKFRALFDNVSSGVAIYEAVKDGDDFIFADVNPATEEIEQIKKEDMIGKSVAEVFPGVREIGLFEVFQRVWKTGVPEHHPVSIYKDDRIAGWRENYVYKLPSGHIIAIYDDMTGSKRSELAARISEQCFRAIADYTYDWEVWVGPGARVLWTNPAVYRLTGYTPAELMAMPDYPEPLIYEKDRRRMTKAFKSAVGGSTGNNVRFRLQQKNGNVIRAEISWQPIYDDKHESLGHRQSIRDITARIQAEEALAKTEHEKEIILDSLAEHVVYQNTDMTILWANRAACESVNMTREQLIGRHCYKVWSDRDDLCPDCPVVKAMKTGKTQHIEKWTPDGRAWFVQGSPVLSDQENLIGAVEITLDITDRKKAEQALRESEQKYRKLAQELRKARPL